jgi:anti-sigma factor RsiW
MAILDLLSDYVDGELKKKDRIFIEKHLVDCSKCEDFVSEFQKTVNWTSECFQKEITIPSEVHERLEIYIEKLAKGEIDGKQT